MKNRIAAIILLLPVLSFSSTFGMNQKACIHDLNSPTKAWKKGGFNKKYHSLQDDGNPLHLSPSEYYRSHLEQNSPDTKK